VTLHGLFKVIIILHAAGTKIFAKYYFTNKNIVISSYFLLFFFLYVESKI